MSIKSRLEKLESKFQSRKNIPVIVVRVVEPDGTIRRELYMHPTFPKPLSKSDYDAWLSSQPCDSLA